MIIHRFISKTLLLACTSILAMSCNRNLDNLAEEYQSGVVMVQTIEYYELRMSNGNTLYFAGSDFDKETNKFISLKSSPDSLIPDIMYGTGFFISPDGRIATNRHVVEGNIKKEEVRQGLRKIIHALEEYLVQEKAHYEVCLSNLESYIRNNPDTIPGSLQAQMEAHELYTQRLNEINQSLRMLRQNNPGEIDLAYHNNVRIAYNNTFVHTVGELKSCTIREKSDKDDLAIIQLNTKQTPEGRHIFRLTPRDMLQHYSFGEYLMHLVGKDKNKTLMMIGYNDGPRMALTDEGIVAQHPVGTISRYLTEDREVQYDIPALRGSSGSPVLNRRGQVVAINYASADSVSNQFNYGVKEKYLFELNKNI